MRSSSGSARLILCVACLVLASCSPKRPAPFEEPVVTLEGEIALAGANPVERELVLSDEGGSICTLRSQRLEFELRRLAGLRVRVTGWIAGRKGETPEFLVDRYEMAPIDGRTPVIGTIERAGADIFLVEWGGAGRYRIAGPLAGVLGQFGGFKVWVVGEIAPGDAGRGRAASIDAQGYGILLAPHALNRAP